MIEFVLYHPDVVAPLYRAHIRTSSCDLCSFSLAATRAGAMPLSSGNRYSVGERNALYERRTLQDITLHQLVLVGAFTEAFLEVLHRIGIERGLASVLWSRCCIRITASCLQDDVTRTYTLWMMKVRIQECCNLGDRDLVTINLITKAGIYTPSQKSLPISLV